MNLLVGLVCLTVLLSDAFPLWQAWRANLKTTLLQAVNWAIGAWAVWIWVFVGDLWQPAGFPFSGYLALCLTGCAGVAVLGARRPGVGPWNLVLLGLLLVLLLFHFQSRIADRAVEWNLPGTLLLAGILLVTVVNYLATCLAPSALLLAVALIGEALLLRSEGSVRQGELVRAISWSALAAVPWLAYWLLRRRPPAPSEFDRIWLAYRDRFGLVWGQRIRDQFNRAAENAGWSLRLRWRGLHILPGAALPDSQTQKEIVAVLQSMLKRFGREE